MGVLQVQATAPERIATKADFRVAGLRWWIIGLVFLATLINFLDRLTISVLSPVLRATWQLSNLQYATLGTWFLLAYTVSHSVSGKFYDRVGVRRGFTCSVLVWSVAAMLHAAARGLGSLSLFRALLGFGEAGNWPGAAKVVAEWFPARERAFGLAIFNSGAALGSVVAPPLIVWLQYRFGWQAVFLITGSLGFLWVALWLAVYRRPEEHRWLGEKERALIEEGSAASASTSRTRPRWRDLFGYRQVWGIVAARLLVDPVWWLYIFWLPEYLNKVRGFSLAQIGLFAWAPYLAADAGSLAGGFASGVLMRRGWSVDRARKTVMLISAAMMPAGILAERAESAMVALVWIAVVLFGFQAWINNLQAMPSDLFPASAVGSVAGLGGSGAGIGSMLFILATGWVVDHFSYRPVLITAGLLAPIGAAVLFWLTPKIEMLDLGAAEATA